MNYREGRQKKLWLFWRDANPPLAKNSMPWTHFYKNNLSVLSPLVWEKVLMKNILKKEKRLLCPYCLLIVSAHRSNPVLAPEERFWRQFFVRPNKIILIKRRGRSVKQKLLEMVQATVLFHTDEFIFVWSFKNGNGRQNRSSGAKLGYSDGRVPKLSFRTLATSGAGVVCHMSPKKLSLYLNLYSSELNKVESSPPPEQYNTVTSTHFFNWRDPYLGFQEEYIEVESLCFLILKDDIPSR